MINPHLALSDIKYGILLDQYHNGNELTEARQQVKKYNREFNKIHSIEIFNAESITSVNRLVNWVKKNGTLVFYPDRNTGMGGVSKQDNSYYSISFFDRPIRIRRGIYEFACKQEKTIFPILFKKKV